MLIGMGVFSMKTSIIFVTEEYRGRIVKKIDLLMRFEVAMKQEEKEHGRIGQIPNYNPEETEEPAGSLPANQPATESVGKFELT
jgi:hypothetical protein